MALRLATAVAAPTTRRAVVRISRSSLLQPPIERFRQKRGGSTGWRRWCRNPADAAIGDDCTLNFTEQRQRVGLRPARAIHGVDHDDRNLTGCHAASKIGQGRTVKRAAGLP